MKTVYKFGELELEHTEYQYEVQPDGSMSLSLNFVDLGWHEIRSMYWGQIEGTWFLEAIPFLFRRNHAAYIKTHLRKYIYR